MDAKVRLSVVTGPHAGRKYCFRSPHSCTAGRGPENFVQLSGEERDAAISRKHCQLEIQGPCVHVEDLQSLNGTFLNGTRIHENQLQDGDLLTLGTTTLRVEHVHCPFDAVVWKEGDAAKRGCRLPCD